MFSTVWNGWILFPGIVGTPCRLMRGLVVKNVGHWCDYGPRCHYNGSVTCTGAQATSQLGQSKERRSARCLKGGQSPGCRICAWVWFGRQSTRLTYARPTSNVLFGIGPNRLRISFRKRDMSWSFSWIRGYCHWKCGWRLKTFGRGGRRYTK